MNITFNTEREYDVVVIGGGTAGVFAAHAAAVASEKNIDIGKVDIDELRERLRAIGAAVPEK